MARVRSKPAPVPKPAPPSKRPSGALVVGAFAIAILATITLVGAALFLREDEGTTVTAPPIDFAGIPQDRLVLGDPAANVTLIEYADLQCPFCRDYAVNVLPTIVDEYIRPGQVKSEYRGIAILGEDSEEALRFVFAAGLQNKLWELQESLYRNQGEEHSGWVTEELVRELASEIPGLDVDRMFTDAEGPEVKKMIEDTAAQAEADQVPGTPTFFIQIGDEDPYYVRLELEPDQFRAALDDALSG
jgi:protein-disulfide isomerase